MKQTHKLNIKNFFAYTFIVFIFIILGQIYISRQVASIVEIPEKAKDIKITETVSISDDNKPVNFIPTDDEVKKTISDAKEKRARSLKVLSDKKKKIDKNIQQAKYMQMAR